MTRRTCTSLALSVATLLASAAAFPAPADAGTYFVRSCFPDGIEQVWHPEYSINATAYKSCPEGIHARNVIGATPAGGFTYARLSTSAPAGTYIDEIAFDGYLRHERGWATGVFDVQNGRWVWCGTTCGSLPLWFNYRVRGFATRSLAFMTICGASSCPRDGQHSSGEIGARNITLRVQDVTNPAVSIVGGSLASGGWKRGIQTVEVAASDNAGVRTLRAFVDAARAGQQDIPCDDHSIAPCPRTARHALHVDLGNYSDGR